MNHAQKKESENQRIFLNCDRCIGLTPHQIDRSGRIYCEYCRSLVASPISESSAFSSKKTGFYRVH